jgi:hypothetical protein
MASKKEVEVDPNVTPYWKHVVAGGFAVYILANNALRANGFKSIAPVSFLSTLAIVVGLYIAYDKVCVRPGEIAKYNRMKKEQIYAKLTRLESDTATSIKRVETDINGAKSRDGAALSTIRDGHVQETARHANVTKASRDGEEARYTSKNVLMAKPKSPQKMTDLIKLFDSAGAAHKEKLAEIGLHAFNLLDLITREGDLLARIAANRAAEVDRLYDASHGLGNALVEVSELDPKNQLIPSDPSLVDCLRKVQAQKASLSALLVTAERARNDAQRDAAALTADAPTKRASIEQTRVANVTRAEKDRADERRQEEADYAKAN